MTAPAGAVHVDVLPDFSQFAARFESGLKALTRNDHVEIKIDVDDSSLRRASKSMKDSDRQVSGLAQKFKNFNAITGLSAPKLIAFASSAGLAVQAVANLGAALAPAAGLLVALPAVAGTAAVAIGTLKLALSGVGDALKAGFEGDAEKYAEALGKLAPAARATVRELVAMKPALDRLKQSVQQRFFEGFSTEVDALGRVYLPVLQKGLPRVADAAGAFAVNFAKAARSGPLLQGVKDILDGTALGLARANDSAGPLAVALGNLLSAGAPYARDMLASIGGIATSFADWVNSAAQSGALTDFIEGALRTFRELGDLLRNVFSIFGSILGAANSAGGSLLQTLGDLTGQLAAFLKSAEGAQALQAIFGAVHEIGRQLGRVMAAVLPAIAQAITELAPYIPPLVTALADILIQMVPLIPLFAQLAILVLTNLTPALVALAPLVGTVVGWLTKLGELLVKYQGWIVPVVAGIGAMVLVIKSVRTAIAAWNVVQAVLNVLLTANPIGLVVLALVGLGAAFFVAWKKSETFRDVVKGAWEKIQQAAKWAWENVLQPTFEALKTGVQFLGDKFTWLWEHVIKPVWSGIHQTIKWVWDNLLVPLFAGIKLYIETWAKVFNWVWDKIVKPVWKGIHESIKFVWDKLLVPLFAGIKLYIETWAKVFGWVKDNVVKPVWDGIKTAISTVWDKGIKPIFNTISKAVKEDLPKAFEAGKKAIGTAWEAVKDVVKAPIKFVVNTVLNDGILSAYNWVASKFGVDPHDLHINLPKGFANGGQIPGPVGATRRDNTIAAVQTGEYIMPVDRTRQFLPVLEAMRAGRLPGFKDGGVWGKVKGAAKSAWDKGKDLGGDARDFLMGPVEWIKNRIKGPLGRLNEVGAGTFGQMIAAIPRRIGDQLVDKIKSLFGNDGEKITGSGSYGGPVGAGVERWRSIALQALAYTHSPASWIGSLLRRMNQESGGNPRAINLWDSNAKAGIPSMGLMQTILPTFNAYAGALRGRGVWDPLANIVASINYANARYGQAPRGWDRAGGYDSGGWLQPGHTLAYNGTGKPEAVLTNAQWQAIERGTSGAHIEINYPPTLPPEQALMESLRRFELVHGGM